MSTRSRHVKEDSIERCNAARENTLRRVTYSPPQGQLAQPLYEGSDTSLLDAVIKHLIVFCSSYGYTKDALDKTLMNEKKSLPSPNNLPENVRQLKQLLKDHLIPVKRIYACVNDCMLLSNNSSKCSHCSE